MENIAGTDILIALAGLVIFLVIQYQIILYATAGIRDAAKFNARMKAMEMKKMGFTNEEIADMMAMDNEQFWKSLYEKKFTQEG